VNPDEPLLAEVPFELLQRPPQNVRPVAHVQARVVAGSFYPVDVCRIQEQHLTGSFHDEPLRPLRRQAAREPALGALQSAVEARVVERLQ